MCFGIDVSRGACGRWLIAFVAVAAVARVAAAQVADVAEVRGVVRDSAARAPVRGAVIELLDSAGAVVRRTITNERGAYRVPLDRHVRRLRVVRIGFRPQQLPVPSAATGAIQLDVAMAPIPAFLEAVVVHDAERCPRRPDRERALALALWEQARSGLLATVVSRGSAPPAEITRLLFARAMDGRSDRILSQTVQIDSSSSTPGGFTAAHSATDFGQFGFAADAGDERTYFGPDAEVLLDDAFARAYCFHVMDGVSGRPNQIGLGFAAASHERGKIDVDGTLWIDTAAHALHDIDFRYVGLDAEIESYQPGGTVSFREMSNGVVVIDRWSLRLVGATLDTLPTAGDRPPKVVRALHAYERGGEVARALWPDGTEWRASLGAIHGVLTEGGRAAPAGVRVALRDTPFATVTDSSGLFEISDLLPGPYRADVSDPEFSAYSFVQDSSIRFAVERGTATGGRFDVKSLDEYIASACNVPIGVAPLKHLLLGRVLDALGRPARDVRVRYTATPPIPPPERPSPKTPDSYVTGSNGQFELCHDPYDGTLIVRAYRENSPLATVARQATHDARLIIVGLQLERTKTP